MTIVDIYKPNKSYRSVNLHKFQHNQVVNQKVTDIYLYMQVSRNVVKNMLCVKYLVLNNLINYLPTKPLEIDEKYTKILNKATIKINKYIKLNIIIVDRLVNTSVFEYKFNFTFINYNNEFIKQFFNFNDLRYKICNVTHKLQNVNAKQVEEELLCSLIDNISIDF